MKKKVVFLTGAGMSVESGFKTFRGNDGLWENYPVEQIASHEGWERDPTLVTEFYNKLRRKLWDAQPCEGHKLIAGMEKDYDVTVLTQNVDNLHEKAGSTKVIHLHGELTKVCSSNDPYDPRYIQELTRCLSPLPRKLRRLIFSLSSVPRSSFIRQPVSCSSFQRVRRSISLTPIR